MNQHEATQLIANDLEYLGGGRAISVQRRDGLSSIFVTMPDDSVLEICVRQLVPGR